jgi:hypothetical protein
LCAEGEFGAALRAFQRQGNTLSQIIRSAWDGTNLGPLVKHNRTFASNPHICLMAHITRHELISLLGNSDIFNGFANRFIWMAVRRGPVTASPKPMADADVQAIAKELARVIAYAHSRDGGRAELVRSNSAEELWAHCYPELTQDRPGILGAVTDRMEAQVTRLSMVYAQLDGADLIEEKHLEAALTFGRYAVDSARHIFGGAEADPVAQRIIEALALGPKTQNDIVGLFHGHLSKDKLGGVLGDLQSRDRIALTKQETGGRPRTVWSLSAK